MKNIRDLIINRSDNTAVTIANNLSNLYEYFRSQGYDDKIAMGEIEKAISKAIAAMLTISNLNVDERKDFVEHLLVEDIAEHYEKMIYGD